MLGAGELAFERLGQSLDDLVGGDADGLVGGHQGVFHNGAVLLLAEDNPDGRILAVLAHLSVQSGEVELHLADKLGLKIANLEFNGHQALEPAME